MKLYIALLFIFHRIQHRLSLWFDVRLWLTQWLIGREAQDYLDEEAKFKNWLPDDIGGKSEN